MTGHGSHEQTLRELVAHVVDDGKSYAKAEIHLWREIVLAKVGIIRPAAIALVVALLFVQAALTVLAAALGMALATWLGVAGGLAAGAVIVVLIAGILAAYAVNRLKRLGQ